MSGTYNVTMTRWIAEEKGYNLFWFDTWSHDKEDEPCCHVVGVKPFYTTVLDIINYTND